MLAGPTIDACWDGPNVNCGDAATHPRSKRVQSLTGIRAVAALLVVGTHAAYGTGKETHSYVGLLYSRLEIGVPIFFVLSGFLLFRPWVKAYANGSAPPNVHRYMRRRVHRQRATGATTLPAADWLHRPRARHRRPQPLRAPCWMRG